jgi:hypothetical protein
MEANQPTAIGKLASAESAFELDRPRFPGRAFPDRERFRIEVFMNTPLKK